MAKLQDEHLTVVRVANDSLRASAGERARAYLCECGDLDCIRTVELAPFRYDMRRLMLDSRILHPFCVVREERSAVLAENRLLRAAMHAKLALLRHGLERLRRSHDAV